MKRIIKSTLAAILVFIMFESASVTSVSANSARPDGIAAVPEISETVPDAKSVPDGRSEKIYGKLSESEKTSAVIGVVISAVAVLAVVFLIIALIPRRKK